MQGFTKTSAVTPKTIVFATEPIMSVGVVVAADGITADKAGRKIVKAGTPMVGSLEERNTAFTVAGMSDTADIKGVLMHDVDVTNGNNNGTLIIFGYINLEHLDEDVLTLITSDVKTALDGKVTFLK